MDQSLRAMAECYGYGGAPSAVDPGEPQGASLDEIMMRFGAAARERTYLPRFAEKLRSATAGEFRSQEALTEFAWFQFSQKNWRALEETVRLQAPYRQFPEHVADLYFLSCFRLCRDIIFEGTDLDEFQSRMDRAMSFIRQIWPHLPVRIRLYEAIVLNSIGDWEAARAVLAELGPDVETIPALSGARSTLPKGVFVAPPTPDMEVHPAAARTATLVSVDEAYFRRYGALFVKAHARSNPGRAVHFHCIGFDPRQIPDGVEHGALIGYTIDRSDLSGLSRINRTGYYAGARFIHAGLHLGYYQDLLISDVDGVIGRSASEVLAERSDADVVLQSTIMQPTRRLFNMPWAAIPAGAVIVRSTDGGRQFAAYMAGYLSTILDAARRGERPLWFADQNALYYAFFDLRNEVRFRRTGRPIYTQGGDWTLFHGDDGKQAHLLDAVRE